MRGKLIVVTGAMIGLLTVAANGQMDAVATNNSNKRPSQEITKTTPAITEIRGVALGMTADEVKEKLGKPKVDDKDGFDYIFSDNVSLQIRLDADGRVNIASITYSGDNAEAPEVNEVFGGDKATTADSSGRIYELVRYPEAGYWVSYSRAMFDSGPTTTVTIQKIR